MSFTLGAEESLPPPVPLPDELKNDYQNALKRNLKHWVEWRANEANKVLSQGGAISDACPLEHYLVQSAHPTENPNTLLAYSASQDSMTQLGNRTFLHFGIPRIKKTNSPDPQMKSPTSPTSASSSTSLPNTLHIRPPQIHKRYSQPLPSTKGPLYEEDPPPDYDTTSPIKEPPPDYSSQNTMIMERTRVTDTPRRSVGSSNSSLDASRRNTYHGSIHVLDHYQGVEKNIDYDFYQPH